MAKFDPVSYKKPKDIRKTMRQLWSYLRGSAALLIFAGILSIIGGTASYIGVYMVKPIVNNAIMPGNFQQLIHSLIFLGIIYLIGVSSSFGYSQIMAHVSQLAASKIRRDLFAHTQKLPLTFFDAHTHGELMSRFTNDVDTIIEMLNTSFTTIIQSAVTLIGTITMIMFLNLKLSIIMIVMQILMVGYIRFSTKRSRKYYQTQQQQIGALNGFIEEMISGSKVEKVFNHQEANFETFCTYNEQLRNISTNAAASTKSMIPVVVTLTYFNYALSSVAGGLLALSGEMDIGSLAAYLVLVRQSSMPLNHMTEQITFLLASLSGAERIFAIMNEKSEPDQGTITVLHKYEEQREKLFWHDPAGQFLEKDIPLQGDIHFNNISFSYTKGKQVLNNISLYAKPGQKIAIVGSTGAGKTTIINLINRFYEIESGEILFDGIPIRQIKMAALRMNISVVVQDTHLFSGTISENIRFGKLDATEDEIQRAAEIAHAEPFIRRLPQGYQTELQHDGGNLSQGQRQLIAIARAAIRQPAVMILDEATSSVDTRTERQIEAGMDSIMEGRTVFVIAHRLSTVRNADAILVLEDGRILERGTHEELLAAHGRYYDLCTGKNELS